MQSYAQYKTCHDITDLRYSVPQTIESDFRRDAQAAGYTPVMVRSGAYDGVVGFVLTRGGGGPGTLSRGGGLRVDRCNSTVLVLLMLSVLLLLLFFLL